MATRSAGRGPKRIADWTLEEKASIYYQIVALVPPDVADAAHERAFATLPATYQRLAADHLMSPDAVSVGFVDDPRLLAQRLRLQIIGGEPPPVVGWLALVADEFFADYFVQLYLSFTIRYPGTPDPPRWSENWIRTLPDHPAPPGTWDHGYPFI